MRGNEKGVARLAAACIDHSAVPHPLMDFKRLVAQAAVHILLHPALAPGQ